MSTHLLPQGEPKMTHELAIPIQNHAFRDAIQNHAFRDAMESHNLREVEISNLHCIICSMARNKVCHLRKLTNNHHDGVLVSLCSWKASDEV